MSGRMILAAVLGGLLATPSLADCGAIAAGKLNGKSIWTLDGAVGFMSPKLEVDADGAPNSYLVNGKGLSYTCDGVTAVGSTPETDPKGWQKKCNAGWAAARASGDYSGLNIFGFLMHKGKPVIQAEGDPLPGEGFISTTSVSIPGAPELTQRRYVDATQVPYVVLSPSFRSKFGVTDGTLAAIYRPDTGKIAYGVYADSGKLGEVSVRMHQDLGNNPIVIKSGTERAKRGLGVPTLTLVFPGVVAKPVADAAVWRKEIDKLGRAALESWGGAEKLAVCAQ